MPLSEQTAWQDQETFPYGADIYEPPRRPSSARRYQRPAEPTTRPAGVQMRVTEHHGPPPGMKARTSARQPHTDDARSQARRPGPQTTNEPSRRQRWLVSVLVALLVLLAGNYAIGWIMGAWTRWQDDIHYGHPRTAQYDSVVGHNHDSQDKPSHFIALNLNRSILVFELPAGDPAKSQVYQGPTITGPGADLTPITLSFRDVTGDGQPDMVIQAASLYAVFVNDHDTFRSPRSGERLNV